MPPPFTAPLCLPAGTVIVLTLMLKQERSARFWRGDELYGRSFGQTRDSSFSPVRMIG